MTWLRKAICFVAGHTLYWHPPLSVGYGQCRTCHGVYVMKRR